ncbi:MAG: alpha/beta hydrolase [Bacteroidales bacterium]|nr:alpha/beta hydrolase [Bacteroidales bacterium]
MKRLTNIFLIIVLISFSFEVIASHKIYILHGYASSKSIMNRIKKDLKKSGFLVENYDYPALYVDLDSLGKKLYLDVLEDNYDSVSFVTHSMGGLVVRNMVKYSAADLNFPKIYRIVMIAPPNRGADIADFFKNTKLIKKMLGPNVEKMTTDSTSYANQLPIPINTELGIIVGESKYKAGYNWFIGRKNDGLLIPERVFLGNEKDVAICNYSHLGVVKNKKPRKLVLEFLKHGNFKSK